MANYLLIMPFQYSSPYIICLTSILSAQHAVVMHLLSLRSKGKFNTTEVNTQF
jgi:hypothetical protein